MKKELLTKTLKQLIKDIANEKYHQERNGMAQAALNLIDEKEMLANEAHKPDRNCNIQHVRESAYDAFDRGFTAGYNAGVKMGLAAD